MKHRRKRKIHVKEECLNSRKKRKKKKTFREKWREYSLRKKGLIIITGITKIASLIYTIYEFT
jgi:hypothetical protein